MEKVLQNNLHLQFNEIENLSIRDSRTPEMLGIGSRPDS